MTKNYFSHDYNTAADPKIGALLSSFGGLGYGVFWRIIEMLHIEESHKLKKKNYVWLTLAQQTSTSVEHVLNILKFCAEECDLLCQDDEYFWSERVFSNVKAMEDKSKKCSKAGKISAIVKQTLTGVNRRSTDSNKRKEKKDIDLSNNEIGNNNKDIGSNNYSRSHKKKLPDDFIVTETHLELAQKNNWPNPQDELEAFRDYHVARGNTMLDWDRAFYTWLRNAKKYKSREGKLTQYQTSKKVANEAFARDFKKNFGRLPRQFQEEQNYDKAADEVDRDIVFAIEDDIR